MQLNKPPPSNDMSCGEFRSGRLTQDFRSSLSPANRLLTALAIIMVLNGCLLLVLGVPMMIAAMCLGFAILLCVPVMISRFAAGPRPLGIRVVRDRLEICYAYRASFIESETSEIRRVSWSYLDGLELETDPPSIKWDVVVHLSPPVPYARGVIGSFRLNGFKSQAKAQAMADYLWGTKMQRLTRLLQRLNEDANKRKQV